jgi:hypothetical protein
MARPRSGRQVGRHSRRTMPPDRRPVRFQRVRGSTKGPRGVELHRQQELVRRSPPSPRRSRHRRLSPRPVALRVASRVVGRELGQPWTRRLDGSTGHGPSSVPTNPHQRLGADRQAWFRPTVAEGQSLRRCPPCAGETRCAPEPIGWGATAQRETARRRPSRGNPTILLGRLPPRAPSLRARRPASPLSVPAAARNATGPNPNVPAGSRHKTEIDRRSNPPQRVARPPTPGCRALIVLDAARRVRILPNCLVKSDVPVIYW